jgi:hypothetical protein
MMVRNEPKVFKKIVLGKDYKKLDGQNWTDIGELLRVTLPEKSRSQIEIANGIYSTVAALHSSDQTVNLKTANAALNAWLKASGRFRLKLGEKTSVKKLTRAEIIARFQGEKRVIRLQGMQPLAFFRYVLASAASAALTTQAEMLERKLTPDLKGDLWLAWVRLVALAVEDAGVRTSASSSNKGTMSPFVTVVQYLQDHLPKYCSRRNGYESVTKGVQLAKLRLGQHDVNALRAVIGGWGTNILGDYALDDVQAIIDKLLSQIHGRTALKK